MDHRYLVSFEPTKKHPKRAIRELVARYPSLEMDSIGEGTALSKNERESRRLFEEAKKLGFPCDFCVSTRYDRNDALSAELGILHFGPTSLDDKGAVLPKDAFDFSTGCPCCGMGVCQLKPHIMSQRAIQRCKANFYDGHEGTSQILLRTEIGREIIEATGQTWCMRHPVTRGGEIVDAWMEPVPCATMPPLSRKSQGVHFGKTEAFAGTGEPPEIVPPCPVCGRNIWDYNREQHTRLVYPGAAIKAAKKHAVVAMHEPFSGFPGFDPVNRTFQHVYGLPWLLFNRAAIEVLLEHIKFFKEHMPDEEIRDSAYIEPVFSE